MVKSRLGPNHDARNTIEARRRDESVDNNRDNRSRHHDDHMDAGGATIATTIASTAGHRTSRVHGLLAGASATRSSPRASGL
jgi:hypothetical protein